MGTLQERATTQSVIGEGAREGQVKGEGVGGDLHIWFRCDVITLISHQRAYSTIWWDRKLGFVMFLLNK